MLDPTTRRLLPWVVAIAFSLGSLLCSLSLGDLDDARASDGDGLLSVVM